MLAQVQLMPDQASTLAPEVDELGERYGGEDAQQDDDDNDQFLMERAFEALDLDHPLRCVGDGKEALEYLSGQGRFANRPT